MKLISKTLLVLLILALVLPLWVKDPAGAPLMTLQDWQQMPGQIKRLAESVGTRLQSRSLVSRTKFELKAAESMRPGDEPDASVRLEAEPASSLAYYRWQDERGVWHFSDQAPPESSDAQVEVLVLDHIVSPGDSALVEQVDTTGAAPPMDSNIAPAIQLPQGVSREEIEQMLQAAHQRRMGDEL